MDLGFTEESKRVNEMSVGISCEEQERLPFDMVGTKIIPSKRESERQVNPRGTLYFQLGRKVSMSEINRIIDSF